MPGNGFVWFWLGDTGWIPYSDEHQNMIERARIQGEEHAVIQIGHGAYMLNFLDNIQENIQNGNRRVISKAPENTVWFWLTDDGRTWNMFSKEHAELLTKAEVERLDEVYLEIEQILYQMDLARREQINFETRHSRQICQGRPQSTAQTPRRQDSIATSDDEFDDPDPEAEEMAKVAPHSFLCPISFRIMRDPVTTSAGSTYDRKAIEWWLRDKDTDPLTKKVIHDKFLISNRAMKNTIEDWTREYLDRKPMADTSDISTTIPPDVAIGNASVAVSSSTPLEREATLPPPNLSASSSLDNRVGGAAGGGHDILKIIFLGKNKMGTSTIVQKLVHGRNAPVPKTNSDANYSNTPPKLKQYDQWNPPAHVQRGSDTNIPLRFNVFDFEGCDSFYLFRSMFFSRDMLYVIVWDMGVSNPETRAETKSDAADEALKRDIEDKVQFWVDLIQERVPDAVILPVASFCDTFNDGRVSKGGDIEEDEALRRCQMLRRYLRPGQCKILFGQSKNGPVIRVSGPSSIGLVDLQERIVEAATNTSHFGNVIGWGIPARHLKAQEAIGVLKEIGSKFTDVESFCASIGDKTESQTREALLWLSNVGEILFYQNETSLPPVLSRFVVIDIEWFAGLCSCLLRPHLDVLVKDIRRRLGKAAVVPFCGSLNVVRTLITKEDAFLLWQDYLDNSVEIAPTLDAKAQTDALDFLQMLFLHFGVIIPIDQDNGPFSWKNICSPGLSSESQYLPPVLEDGESASSLDTNLFFIPSLLEQGDHGAHGEAFAVFRLVTGSTVVVGQVTEFLDRTPEGFMARVIAVLFRNMHALYTTRAQTGVGIAAKSVHCWRSIFRIKFSATERTVKGEIKETVVEVCAQLIESATSKFTGLGDADDQKRVKACLFTSGNKIRGDGPNIWRAGYGLVIETIRAVLGGYADSTHATRVFCHKCLMDGGLYGARLFSQDEVRGGLENDRKTIQCQRGHAAIVNLLAGSGDYDDNSQVDSKEADVRQAVVLIGLYDDRQRTEKIIRLGSGFVADSERGLIVTSARNVMQIDGEERFGQNYDGILGAKIVVGVIPKEGGSDAVFRYYAKLIAKDPSLDNPNTQYCRVDACVLKITSRFEDDVGGNGDECSDEIEVLLRDNPDKVRAQGLVPLPLTVSYKLQDRVRMLGYEQKDEVNRQFSKVEGYVCQEKIETDTGPLRYHYQPLKTIVVMARAKYGLSGAPCVNENGEVIGILGGADPGEDLRSFVVPVSEWRGLLGP
mgnify:CR=1 FL=1